jgi:Virulence factor BrkB
MPSGREQWVDVAKAIYGRFGEVQVTDRAAALSYYSILSLFPALLVVVSLLALLGEYPDTYQNIVGTGRRRRRDRQRSAQFAVEPEQRRHPAGRRPRSRAVLGLGSDGGGDALPRSDQPGEGRP